MAPAWAANGSAGAARPGASASAGHWRAASSTSQVQAMKGSVKPGRAQSRSTRSSASASTADSAAASTSTSHIAAPGSAKVATPAPTSRPLKPCSPARSASGGAPSQRAASVEAARPSSAPSTTAQVVPPAHAPQASAAKNSAPVRALSMKMTWPAPRRSASRTRARPGRRR